MITIKEMMDGVSGIDESELFKISDKLWKIGRLEEIKETVSPDLFYLHVGINMIGNWKGDGWWFLICEQADFVPYIPTALDKLNLPELKTAFEIGFIIFIPFIVLDLVVANILLALGMFMLSPTIVSLPFKLLIFIAVDGWSLIVKGLVESFN